MNLWEIAEAMTKPTVDIEIVQIAGGVVDFDATVAGHKVKLRMPEEFVEDEIQADDEAAVRAYFSDYADDIQDAARTRAYEHSTRDQKPGDPPGAVPYSSSIKMPFDKIQIREV